MMASKANQVLMEQHSSWVKKKTGHAAGIVVQLSGICRTPELFFASGII